VATQSAITANINCRILLIVLIPLLLSGDGTVGRRLLVQRASLKEVSAVARILRGSQDPERPGTSGQAARSGKMERWRGST
jgi:hypothetical protein